MNIIILQTSPNLNGLTAACANAAAGGARTGGAVVNTVCLNDQNVGRCLACANGWGTCRTEHECQVLDGFQELHHSILEADGLVLVTPVYWGDLSESAKALTDRLRRCEASRRETSPLAGKPFFAVAAAGGSGNGTISCLSNIERWAQHTGMQIMDLIPVNRWTREYKLAAVRAAGALMANGFSTSVKP